MLQVNVFDRWALMVLSGEFDIVNSDTILAMVSDLIDGGVTEVTADVSEVTFLDVSTLNALLAAHRQLAAVDGRLTLVGASPLVQRILEVTAVTAILAVFTSPPGPTLPMAPGEPFGGRHAGDSEDVTRRFQELAAIVLRRPSLTGDLEGVLRAAAASLAGCDAASISLIVKGDARSAVASGRVAIEVDLAQYTVAQGPCLDVLSAAQRIRVDVLDVDERYPHFAPMAAESGVHATLSAPIWLHDTIVGSLNLYSTTPRGFHPEDEPVADVLAAQAATAIAKHDAYHAARRLAAAAQQHADDQTTIHQAEGVLTATLHCSIEQAERLLTGTAHTNQEPLLRAAQRILTHIEH